MRRAEFSSLSSLVVGALAFLLASAAYGQARIPRVPAATVQRVIASEYAFCARTEGAIASELDAIEAEIQDAMDQAQRRVDQLAADSARAAARLTNAQAKVDEIDARLSPLQVERSKVLSDMKPFADQIASLEQGNAPVGAAGEHAQLMAREAELRDRIAAMTAELEKLRSIQRGGPVSPLPAQGDEIQRFFQNMAGAEGPVADLRRAQQQLEEVMARLREIRRETIPIRFDPQYVALLRRLEELNRQIATVETELDAARRGRDEAKTASEQYDGKALELAHVENLYIYEHMIRARHCIEKRREQLNRAAPAAPATPARAASGQWSVQCRFKDPDYGNTTDGGGFSLTPTLDGRGGVRGAYVSSNASYEVTGRIAPDGSASGTGAGSGWTVTWSGRFAEAGGNTVGNGSVNVTFTDVEEGGTCTGTWSIP
jgi:predicted nuclease with TOPRIM domain